MPPGLSRQAELSSAQAAPRRGCLWIAVRQATAAATKIAATVACLLVPIGATAAFADAPDAQAVARGEYIFTAAGCTSCHTDSKHKGAFLAGGVALPSPFGTFYGPNITPDPTYGIGRWSEADFIRAVREGQSPGGGELFPAFPYTSFTKMSDADVKDLWAYLRTVPPVATPSKPHEVSFPFNIRIGVFFWKKLFFTAGRFEPDPAKSPEINRGAYVAQALSHCGECHTPRNFLGGLQTSMAYAGARHGPDGHTVPNITPDPETGIGKWSAGDISDVLKSGMTPDGDFVGGAMAEEVQNTTGKLTEADLRAVLAYLKSLPAIRNQVEDKKAD